MDWSKKSRRQAGSCMTCDRGELAGNGIDLVYPYEYVYVIHSRSTEVRICDNCLKVLKTFEIEIGRNRHF